MDIDALTIADIKKIIERYKNGEYLTPIADDYNFSLTDARRLIDRLSKVTPNWPEIARARTQARQARQADLTAQRAIKEAARRAEREAEEARREARRVIRAQYTKAPHRPPPEEILKRSFEAPVTGDETLFCDTEFLEKIFQRPVKRADECDPVAAQEPPGVENEQVPGQEDQEPEKR